ncbi:MAG TPA: hypothetical protein DDY76_08190 [Opitutae bacterium]|nr:hypothetical protein [Opitutae bacterium]
MQRKTCSPIRAIPHGQGSLIWNHNEKTLRSEEEIRLADNGWKVEQSHDPSLTDLHLHESILSSSIHRYAN